MSDRSAQQGGGSAEQAGATREAGMSTPERIRREQAAALRQSVADKREALARAEENCEFILGNIEGVRDHLVKQREQAKQRSEEELQRLATLAISAAEDERERDKFDFAANRASAEEEIRKWRLTSSDTAVGERYQVVWGEYLATLKTLVEAGKADLDSFTYKHMEEVPWVYSGDSLEAALSHWPPHKNRDAEVGGIRRKIVNEVLPTAMLVPATKEEAVAAVQRKAQIVAEAEHSRSIDEEQSWLSLPVRYAQPQQTQQAGQLPQQAYQQPYGRTFGAQQGTYAAQEGNVWTVPPGMAVSTNVGGQSSTESIASLSRVSSGGEKDADSKERKVKLDLPKIDCSPAKVERCVTLWNQTCNALRPRVTEEERRLKYLNSMRPEDYTALTIPIVTVTGQRGEIPFINGTCAQMQLATLNRYAGRDAKLKAAQEMVSLVPKKDEDPRTFRDRQVSLQLLTGANPDDTMSKTILLRSYPEEARDLYKLHSNPQALGANELVEAMQRMWIASNDSVLFVGGGKKAKSVAAARFSKRLQVESEGEEEDEPLAAIDTSKVSAPVPKKPLSSASVASQVPRGCLTEEMVLQIVQGGEDMKKARCLLAQELKVCAYCWNPATITGPFGTHSCPEKTKWKLTVQPQSALIFKRRDRDDMPGGAPKQQRYDSVPGQYGPAPGWGMSAPTTPQFAPGAPPLQGAPRFQSREQAADAAARRAYDEAMRGTEPTGWRGGRR